MKWLSGAFGFICLYYILSQYGFGQIAKDIEGLGWWAIPLVLSSLPVLTLYGLAWWLVTPSLGVSTIPNFVRFTIITIAWNNLSPFVKILGEPIKVLLLERYIPRKDALKSLLLYNLVHIYGTIAAFLIGAISILAFYPTSGRVRWGFTAIIVIAILLFKLLYFTPYWLKKGARKKKKKISFWLKLSFWMKWSNSKIRIFYKKHPYRFLLSVFLETLSRFVEGGTFYIAFLALGDRIGILEATLLDVSRALFDNLFFFIPYQVGSREGTILMLTQHVFNSGAKAAVGAAVMYRLVEICWMVFGYILWISAGNSRKSKI